MSDLSKRLKASIRYEAINGNAFERSICGNQREEAARELDIKDIIIGELREKLEKAERAVGEILASTSRTERLFREGKK